MAIRQLADGFLCATAAAKILGRHPQSVDRICRAGGVRIQAFPGEAPRYHRADLEALVVRSTADMEQQAAAAQTATASV